jgi:hypothetical protein
MPWFSRNEPNDCLVEPSTFPPRPRDALIIQGVRDLDRRQLLNLVQVPDALISFGSGTSGTARVRHED